jgi:hypothetical protein
MGSLLLLPWVAQGWLAVLVPQAMVGYGDLGETVHVYYASRVSRFLSQNP